LYDFLKGSVTYLDNEFINLSLYPLIFLLQLSLFLGFAPASALEFYEQLRQGAGQIPFGRDEELHLDQLIASTFDTTLKIPGTIRRRLLDHVLLFYKLHLDTFSEIRSIKVLANMMH